MLGEAVTSFEAVGKAVALSWVGDVEGELEPSASLHALQVSRHAAETPGTAHLFEVCLLATQIQLREIRFSCQSNLNRVDESTHLEQEVHVAEHISDTPSTLHLFAVCLFATQIHPLLMFLPFQLSLNLNVESSQEEEEAAGNKKEERNKNRSGVVLTIILLGLLWYVH